MSLQETFGNIDIYLFDQLLKGRIVKGDRVLDAGCGSGRNVHYLLREKFDVCGVDENPKAVDAFRTLADELEHPLPETRARVATLDQLPFDDHAFDVVICSAVLHFARDHAHFIQMVRELFRALRPGGLLFARLASAPPADLALPGNNAYTYLTTETELMRLTADYGALLDPLKTTIVHGQRAMTTWVVRRGE